MNTNTAEGDLAKVAFGCCGGLNSKKVLANSRLLARCWRCVYRSLPVAAMDMARGHSIFQMPCMVYIKTGIGDRLRTSPSIRVVGRAMGARASIFCTQIEIRFWGSFPRSGYLVNMLSSSGFHVLANTYTHGVSDFINFVGLLSFSFCACFVRCSPEKCVNDAL